VFWTLIAWGMLAALTGVLRQFWMLVVDRFLLGVAESCIFPAMLLLLTRWFTRAERSRANTVLILGNPITVIWMSAITGFLIQDFGWQKTFIIEGIPSVLWAGVWILLVRDKPSEAKWLMPEAARHLEMTLAEEQVSIPMISGVRDALLRKDVMLLSVQYFCWSIGVYGFVLWLPTILRRGGGLSMATTGLLAACPYCFAVAAMLLVSYISDKTLRRKVMIWPLLLLSAFALFGSFLFAQKSFVAGFLCLIVGGACMYAPYGPFFAIVPERVPKNVVAEAMACINSCGALGAFFGSYFVGLLRALTGNERAGYLLMSLSLACAALLFVFIDEPRRSRAATALEVGEEL
jgi:sugar phosphate permease